MVELQIVILAVAGSSPVGHPFSIGDLSVRGLFVRNVNRPRPRPRSDRAGTSLNRGHLIPLVDPSTNAAPSEDEDE